MVAAALIIHPENTLHKVFDGNFEKTTLPYWMKLYLDRKVAGIQSAHTLEAKARDLLGFLNWFMHLNGHQLITEWHLIQSLWGVLPLKDSLSYWSKFQGPLYFSNEEEKLFF